MKRGSQANEHCLFQVARIRYPKGWEQADEAKRKKLLPDVLVEGEWLYMYNETPYGVQQVNAKRFAKQNRDKGDNRLFVPPPVPVDTSRVFIGFNPFGQWKWDVPYETLAEEVQVFHGPLPLDAPPGSFWYDQEYSERFMTFTTYCPSGDAAATTTWSGGSAAAAAVPVGPEHSASTSPPVEGPENDDGEITDNSQDDDARDLPAAAVAAEEAEAAGAAAAAAVVATGSPAAVEATTAEASGEAAEGAAAARSKPKLVSRPVCTFLTACGKEPPVEVLREFGLHRAQNPALRTSDPGTYCVLDLCCGCGGAVFHPPTRQQLQDLLRQGGAAGSARGTGARQVGQAAGAGPSSAGSGAGGSGGSGASAPVAPRHAGRRKAAVAGAQADAAGGSASSARGPSAPCQPAPAPAAAAGGAEVLVKHRWAVDMIMSALTSYAANNGDVMALLCMRLAELKVLLRLVNGLAVRLGPPAEKEQEEEDDESEDGEQEEEEDWEVMDILAVRLDHFVEQQKDGQLVRELRPEDCSLSFLVRWRYDEARDKERWPDHTELGEYEWVPLDDLGCDSLLRCFLHRLLHVEGLLPRPGQRTILVAGTPCQGMSGHNHHAHVQPVMEVQKNLIVLDALSIAEFLEVHFIVLEQVQEAAQLENGTYRRMVQATIAGMRGGVTGVRYQQRLGLIHAANHGAPQARPRMFIVAAAAHQVLPPLPRPEFSFDVVLDEPSGRRQGRRPRVTALDRCQPVAGEGAEMFPSQVVADAISGQEEVRNFNMSPVTFAREPDYPLQHYAARPTPEGTPSAELRFACYLGNCAPAVLAFARAVLHAYHQSLVQARTRVKRREADRARRARKKAAMAAEVAVQAATAAAGAAGAAGQAKQASAAAAKKQCSKGGAASAPVAATGDVADKVEEEAMVEVGAAIAALDVPAPGRRIPSPQEGVAAGRKRTLAQASNSRRLSHLAAGKEAVRCAQEALLRAREHAPWCLAALQAELARLEGRPAGEPAPSQATGSGAVVPKPGSGSGDQQPCCRGGVAPAQAGSEQGRCPSSGGATEQEGGGAGSLAAAAGSLPCSGGDQTVRRVPVANHVPFPLSLSKYERVQAVPLGGGHCFLDIPGCSRCGARERQTSL